MQKVGQVIESGCDLILFQKEAKLSFYSNLDSVPLPDIQLLSLSEEEKKNVKSVACILGSFDP